MSEIDGRILVFAGAGASKAIRSEKFPTTKEFFDDLPSSISSEPTFNIVIEYLKEESKSEIIDIEQVLWTLQSLYEFLDAAHKPKGVVSFLFKKGFLNELVNNQSIGSFVSLSRIARTKLESLIGSINEIVYELYGYEPKSEELQNNWIELISILDGLGTKLDLFTTNYDVAIEAALADMMGEVTARRWRGIRGAVRQVLDFGSWMDENEHDETGLLTKLHGSLDWKMRGEDIFVGDPVFTGDHSKQAIVYPGFKGESGAPFFQIFHEYLAQSISDSAIMIFIGFAFRDEHINRLIRENIKRKSRVFIINPDKSIKFPSARVQPKYLHSGFDVAAIKAIERAIYS